MSLKINMEQNEKCSFFLKTSRNLVVKCKARFATFVVFEYAYLPSPLLREFPSRALYYSYVSRLESCLFSQLKVELPSLLGLYFLLFCVSICCEKSFLGEDRKKLRCFLEKLQRFSENLPRFWEKLRRFMRKLRGKRKIDGEQLPIVACFRGRKVR